MSIIRELADELAETRERLAHVTAERDALVEHEVQEFCGEWWVILSGELDSQWYTVRDKAVAALMAYVMREKEGGSNG